MEALIHVLLTLSLFTTTCLGDDLVATITLGASANYFGSAIATPTGTNYDISLVAPNPSQGVDLFLSPQQFDLVKKAVTDNCGNGADVGSDKCQAAINSALTDKDGVNIQKRFVPLLVTAGGVAAVLQTIAAAAEAAFYSIVAFWAIGQASNNNIHLGPGDIAQLTGIKSATAVVFKTDGTDTKPVTVPITVAPTDQKPTGVAPAFSTATADGTGITKGDIILSLPGDLANQANGVLDNIVCKRSKRQASSITSCDILGAKSLLLATTGLLEPFKLLVESFQFVDKDFLNVQGQIVDWAKSINLQFDNDDRMNGLASVYLFLTIYRFHSGNLVSNNNDIPAASVTAGPTPTPSQSSTACPPPDREPMCVNCGGETTTGRCPGDPKYDNEFKDCDCIQSPGNIGRPSTPALGLDGNLLLSYLPPFSPTIKTPGNITCPDDEKYTLTTDLFSKISAQFCNDNPNLKNNTQESLTTDKIKDWNGDSSYGGYTFSWSWASHPRQDLGSRPPDCQDMWAQLAKGPSCNLGNNQWTRTGQLYTFLGMAQFAIIPPNYQQPKPPVDYKKAIYVIWDVPPVSGQPFYQFFGVDSGYTTSLDNKCGSAQLPISPIATINDPKLGRIDDQRKAGQSFDPGSRAPPGDIGSIGFANNCHYVENDRGTAQLTCDGGTKFDCHVPDSGLMGQVTPNNGGCGDPPGDPPNVRMLVMVCPYNTT